MIGLHKIRDAAAWHRAGRRSVTRTLSLSGEAGTVDPAAADDLARSTLRMVLEELLSTLPDAQKAIVMLRLDGESVDEISRRTRRAKRTVERTLQTFRSLMQSQLEMDRAGLKRSESDKPGEGP